MNFTSRLLALLVLLAASAAAQTFTPKSIVFSGVPADQTAELLKVTQLTAGKPVTKDELEAAMHRLDDTGLFNGINYGFTGGVLTFTLEPLKKAEAQRVVYTNFVMFNPEDLTVEVHKRLPLFDGTVPNTGGEAAQVERTLEAILKDRGISATVKSDSVMGGRIDYSIATPPVIVGDIQIENVRFDSDPQLVAVRRGLVGQDYLGDVSNRAVSGNLAAALEELGYLDQTIGPVKPASPVITPSRITVSLTGTAMPGPRYTVAKVVFPALAGTVTEKDYVSDFQVKPGGPASPSLVKNTQLRMQDVFQAHGFLDAQSSVTPSKDATAHTMSYTFQVMPGEVYRMRLLLFDPSLSDPRKRDLMSAWTLTRGVAYDRATAFHSTRSEPAKAICGGRPAAFTLLPQKSTHEVDVSLSCPGASAH